MTSYNKMTGMWNIVDGKYVYIVQIEEDDKILLYTNGKLEATLDIATNKYTIIYDD